MNIKKIDSTYHEYICDSALIGMSNYYMNNLSFLIIDVDLVLEPEFKNGKQISIFSPSKVVLKDFAYNQIIYNSTEGIYNISIEPEIIEKLKMSICNKFNTFTFSMLGGGHFSVNAKEGFLLIPNHKITVNGQTFFAPSRERVKFTRKYFNNNFLDALL